MFILQQRKTEILYEFAFDCLHSIFMVREGLCHIWFKTIDLQLNIEEDNSNRKGKNTYTVKKQGGKKNRNLITSSCPATKHIRYYRVCLMKWGKSATSNSHNCSFVTSASRTVSIMVKFLSLFTVNESYYRRYYLTE